MKYTGIVRKIDELGRIVIPKEIRNILHIKSNDDLEFLIEDNHIVLFKDNNNNLKTLSNDILESTKGLVKGLTLITDKEKILTYGNYIDENVPLVWQRLLDERKEYISMEKESYTLSSCILNGFIMVCPLLIESSPIGIIIYISENVINESEKLYCHMIKNLIENR